MKRMFVFLAALGIAGGMVLPAAAEDAYIETGACNYSAQTNETYTKTIVYNVDRRGSKPDVVDVPSDDEYFMFRVRTVTNEAGNVVHANYGRIGERSDHMFGLRMKTWFNRNDRDTNLEDERQR